MFDEISLFQPELALLVGIWDVASAIWDLFDPSAADNLFTDIMKQVETLVHNEIERNNFQTVNAELNVVYKNIQRYHDLVKDESSGEAQLCTKYLTPSLQELRNVYSFIEYDPMDGARYYLPQLLQIASLEMGIYREMHINGAKPNVCCNLEGDNCNSVDYVQDMEGRYTKFYNDFLSWVPQWYDWRVLQGITSTWDPSRVFNYNSFTATDTITGTRCYVESGSDFDVQAFADGTHAVMQNEVTAKMMGLMDPFSGLHRLIPGREKDARIYPDVTAAAPLSGYQSGFELGPYVMYYDGFNLVGLATQNTYLDASGKVEAVSVQNNGELAWTQVRYNYGLGHEPASRPDSGIETTVIADVKPNGRVQSISLYAEASIPEGSAGAMGGVQVHVANDQDKEIVDGPIMGCQEGDGCSKVITVTVGAHRYELVGWSQRNTRVGSLALSSIWMPKDVAAQRFARHRNLRRQLV